MDTSALTVTITQGGGVVATRVIPGATLTDAWETLTFSLTELERRGLRDVALMPLAVTMAWTPSVETPTVEVDQLAVAPFLASPPPGPAQTVTCGVAVATAVAKDAVCGGVRAPHLGPTQAQTRNYAWNGSTFELTETITVEDADDRMLFRVVTQSVAPSFVSFNGVTLTPLISLGDGNISRIAVYEAPAPAAGTYPLVMRASSGVAVRLVVNGVRGVHTSTPTRTPVTEAGWNAVSEPAPSVRMDLVTDVIVHQYPLAAGDNLGADDVGSMDASRRYGFGHAIAAGTSTVMAWVPTQAGWAAHGLVAYVPQEATLNQTATPEAAVATAVGAAPVAAVGPITATAGVGVGTALAVAPTALPGGLTAMPGAAVATAMAAGATATAAGIVVPLPAEAAAVAVTPTTAAGPVTASPSAAVATAVAGAPTGMPGGRTATPGAAVATATALGAIGTVGAVSRTIGAATATAVGATPAWTAGGITATASTAMGTAVAVTPLVSLGAVTMVTVPAIATAGAWGVVAVGLVHRWARPLLTAVPAGTVRLTVVSRAAPLLPVLTSLPRTRPILTVAARATVRLTSTNND